MGRRSVQPCGRVSARSRRQSSLPPPCPLSSPPPSWPLPSCRSLPLMAAIRSRRGRSSRRDRPSPPARRSRDRLSRHRRRPGRSWHRGRRRLRWVRPSLPARRSRPVRPSRRLSSLVRLGRLSGLGGLGRLGGLRRLGRLGRLGRLLALTVVAVAGPHDAVGRERGTGDQEQGHRGHGRPTDQLDVVAHRVRLPKGAGRRPASTPLRHQAREKVSVGSGHLGQDRRPGPSRRVPRRPRSDPPDPRRRSDRAARTLRRDPHRREPSSRSITIRPRPAASRSAPKASTSPTSTIGRVVHVEVRLCGRRDGIDVDGFDVARGSRPAPRPRGRGRPGCPAPRRRRRRSRTEAGRRRSGSRARRPARTARPACRASARARPACPTMAGTVTSVLTAARAENGPAPRRMSKPAPAP